MATMALMTCRGTAGGCRGEPGVCPGDVSGKMANMGHLEKQFFNNHKFDYSRKVEFSIVYVRFQLGSYCITVTTTVTV